jgi:hypothetical protein
MTPGHKTPIPEKSESDQPKELYYKNVIRGIEINNFGTLIES